VAISFVILLLVLATTSQGAFTIGHWAPLALFVLAILIAALATGRAVVLSSASRIVLVSIWGLTAWALLSMLWAASPADAWTAANRTALYAALVTLPFILPLRRESLAAAGWSLSAGVSAVAVYTTIHLLLSGESLFLAGRLNGPVNYRNATALLFTLPVWPLIVATAARSYRRGVRATAFAMATLCLGLAFLTQSRGIIIGLIAGGIVALALGPDRVRRAWIAVLTVAAVALASPWLLRPYHAFQHTDGYVAPHPITVAAWALVIMTAIAFGVGMLIALFDNGLRANADRMHQIRRAARIALVVGAVLVAVGGLAAIGNPVTYAQSKWDQFTSLNANTTTGSTRLLSTGGQRYDLWRVAVKEFESAPILGVGADNYWFDYYRDRHTNRNLNDPHSLVFSLLSEGGIVGVLLFAGFLTGLVLTVRRGWPKLSPRFRRHAVAPAAAGVVLLGQSTVDWIWLIPGLTAIGLLSLAIAAALCDSERSRVAVAAGRRWRLARPVGIAALVVSVVSVLALFISDAYIQRARSEVGNPAGELSAARTAGAFDPWSTTPHYLQASALESMGNRPAAYRELQDALSLEPRNFATLGVLGDFEARGDQMGAARSFYRRALDLNPLDSGLQQLAKIGLAVTAKRSR
jgi:O-antigen ligase